MRHLPPKHFQSLPCSIVAITSAKKDLNIYTETIFPKELREDGYLDLNVMNKLVRANLPVKKKQYFKKTERISLEDFLGINEEKCIVCVYGHYIYVNKANYESFFENEKDKIVCIWFLK
jgi:hypothetical protein